MSSWLALFCPATATAAGGRGQRGVARGAWPEGRGQRGVVRGDSCSVIGAQLSCQEVEAISVGKSLSIYVFSMSCCLHNKLMLI